MESITNGDILAALEDGLRQGGLMCLPVSGVSMGARLASAESIVVQGGDRARVWPGSIVVYSRHGRWIAHRALWVFPKSSRCVCVTKGDAVGVPDHPWVSRNEYMGVVVAVKRGDSIKAIGVPDRMAGLFMAVLGLAEAALRLVFRRARLSVPA